MGGRDWQDIPSETFCLTVPKCFVIEHFSVSLISAMEKNFASEGKVMIFSRKVLSRSTEMFRSGTFLCFRMFRVTKNLMHRKGVSRFFVESL